MDRHFLEIEKGEVNFNVVHSNKIGGYSLDKPHVVVSITKPGNPKIKLSPNLTRFDALHLSFFSREENERSEKQLTPVQAKKIIDFIFKWKITIDHYIISSDGNQDKNGAIALLFAEILGCDTETFVGKVKVNPFIYETLKIQYLQRLLNVKK